MNDGTYIITSVHFGLDVATGKRATLGLENADAYKVDPTFETRQNTLLDWAAKEGAAGND